MRAGGTTGSRVSPLSIEKLESEGLRLNFQVEPEDFIYGFSRIA
jgi:hypothetical protein